MNCKTESYILIVFSTAWWAAIGIVTGRGLRTTALAQSGVPWKIIQTRISIIIRYYYFKSEGFKNV